LTLNTLQSEFPVIRESDGSVQGMVCQKDILKTLKSTGETGMVHQALRSDFPVVRSTDLVFQAQKTMTNAGLDAVPVLDEMNRLEGLLTSRDINEAYQLISVNASLRALAA
jgi:CBS domain containing-hemolysin-like protein